MPSAIRHQECLLQSGIKNAFCNPASKMPSAIRLQKCLLQFGIKNAVCDAASGSNCPPDSSITPVLREIEDPKPPQKSEPRNGLDTSHYIDPIERSLASLERSLKAEVPMDDNVGVSDSSMRLEEEFSLPKQQMMPDAVHQTLMAQLGGLAEITRLPDQIKTDTYLPPHNGYGEQHMKHEREMLRPDMIPNMPGLTNIQPMSSIFDPVPVIPHSVIAQSHHGMPTAPCMTPAIKKEENKPLLTPKPIEDLMGVSNMQQNNISERAKYEMEKKISEETKNSNFAAAFKLKQEQNLKNASSWSSLAQAGSPQSIPSVVPSTAQAFKKQAREKIDRQRALIEQQELRKKEQQAERERQRQQETERRHPDEEKMR
ncbi:putative bromodomain containing 3 [Operophtera brumata]|uniref:Putative bromodomain containing 3 n=1 Tax=Operophtera brumata TaxID=104452 RepID=A0A0L7L0V9_OPEBR|nr:putative bromodomain containing 3 [Operophtera brumata]